MTDLRIRMEGSFSDGLEFVEVENDDGEGVGVGEWTQEDGYWFLDLTLKDILNLIAEDPEEAFIVREDSTMNHKIFLDYQNAKEENSRGHWSERALYPGEFVPVSNNDG